MARAWDEASLWYAGEKCIQALDDARVALAGIGESPPFAFDWSTPWGWIRVRGGGADQVDGTGALLIVDLGGDDVYTGGVAASTADRPIGLLLDCGGDDRYESNEPAQGAGMCGIDIDALLAGAAEMKTCVEKTDWRANPACMLAAIKYLAFTAKGKPMHVMMPYSNRLGAMADWFRQLWAESLGKQTDRTGAEVFTGPTPIKALGHSFDVDLAATEIAPEFSTYGFHADYSDRCEAKAGQHDAHNNAFAPAAFAGWFGLLPVGRNVRCFIVSHICSPFIEAVSIG